MWTRESLESDVLDLLQPLQAQPFNYKVMRWPDRELDGSKMDKTLLVAITEESWDPPQTMDAIDQAGQLSLQTQAVQRSRIGPKGQLELRHEVQRLLTRDIPGAGRCYLQSAGLLPRVGPVWRYLLDFVIEVNLSEMDFSHGN